MNARRNHTERDARILDTFEYLETLRTLVPPGTRLADRCLATTCARTDEAHALVRLRALAAYEADRPDDAIVRFCQKPGILTVDASLLWAALQDRVFHPDEQLGVSVLEMLQRALGFSGQGAELIRHAPRLLPGAPVIECGLLEVRGDSHWFDQICVATQRLEEWAVPGLPALAPTAAPGLAVAAASASQSQGAPLERGADAALILPPATEERFEMVLRLVQSRQRCLEEFGLARLLPEGTGVAVLFYGPPGCGKTLAARILARRLSRPLHLVQAGRLQSRYFGETEERIEQAFRKAERSNAVLLLDEADSIVVDRSDAPHPAYRSFTNVLLGAIEATNGVVVLTTNSAQHLDPALERRLSMRIEIGPPEELQRELIWRSLIPDTIRVAPDVDLSDLASQPMSGGEIKNAVVVALSEAALRGEGALRRIDVDAGVRAALEGRWASEKAPRIGFGRNGSR